MPVLEATRECADRARPPEVPTLQNGLEQHRRELTGYCRRVLGSSFEAEDAVQETLVRAWRNFDRFEGRATLRSWLYRIATNVCADMMRRPQRRARPMDLGPLANDEANPGAARAPGGGAALAAADPAEMAASRETMVLALTVLQQLPSRQRAVLILREVLRWKAEEVAELLGVTVASVNSALQRARCALGAAKVSPEDARVAVDATRRRHLAACVDAFGQVHVESLMALLHRDATDTRPRTCGS
ncbi:MAG TPA: RNA polymerase subunit sigma-70 [Acidimicrobiales bacterium]|nr:RNA polymerase subunit sigma-70 [Acidimicrobiales bacterium]